MYLGTGSFALLVLFATVMATILIANRRIASREADTVVAATRERTTTTSGLDGQLTVIEAKATELRQNRRMIRIAISAEALEAIARTLPLSSAGYESATKASGSIWPRYCCTPFSAWSPGPTPTGKCMSSFAFICSG